MRNYYSSTCCSNGEPIIGRIIYGKKFPFGTVSQEQYEEDMDDINTKIANVGEVAMLANSKTDEASQKIQDNKNSISSLNAAIASNKSEIYNVKNDIINVEKENYEMYTALDRRLKALEGSEALEILSFSASPATSERGIARNIVLSWTLSGSATVTKIDGEVVTGNTYTSPSVTTTKDFTLSVTDARGRTLTSRTTAKFLNRIKWGKTSESNMSAAVVASLAFNELSDTKTREISVPVNNDYVVYALPKRLGTVQFEAGGFTGGFEDPVTLSITNSSGYTEDYYVYRSTNKLTGTAEIKVKN